jgi:hypothetical protein
MTDSDKATSGHMAVHDDRMYAITSPGAVTIDVNDDTLNGYT